MLLQRLLRLRSLRHSAAAVVVRSRSFSVRWIPAFAGMTNVVKDTSVTLHVREMLQPDYGDGATNLLECAS